MTISGGDSGGRNRCSVLNIAPVYRCPCAPTIHFTKVIRPLFRWSRTRSRERRQPRRLVHPLPAARGCGVRSEEVAKKIARTHTLSTTCNRARGGGAIWLARQATVAEPVVHCVLHGFTARREVAFAPAVATRWVGKAKQAASLRKHAAAVLLSKKHRSLGF